MATEMEAEARLEVTLRADPGPRLAMSSNNPSSCSPADTNGTSSAPIGSQTARIGRSETERSSDSYPRANMQAPICLADLAGWWKPVALVSRGEHPAVRRRNWV